MSPRAYLALGSNLGDRLANLLGVVERLNERRIRTVRSSRVYETEPVGGPAQPPYLNAVIEVETDLEPHQLLRKCLEVEDSLGRVREERWGPRTADIDILTFDDVEIDEDALRIPHPRAHERGFVLIPLLELEPDPKLRGGRRVSTLRLGPATLAGVSPHSPPLLERR
ncbi:MAG: 2-amino-4-hydroxy-6-hydroxymethyldihydropteridine diphosphokinase [Actinomycetota bacterium]|nr:2-amino-4-hydroxy-6-hydroxymethyldihydropteridine diphosphokinase [Actinomycetota bacterium]